MAKCEGNARVMSGRFDTVFARVTILLAWSVMGCDDSTGSPPSSDDAGSDARASSPATDPTSDASVAESSVAADDASRSETTIEDTGASFQPTAPSGTQAADANVFCADVHTYLTRCASASCAQAFDSACIGTWAPAESDAYADAFHHCVTTGTCSDASGESSCMVPLVNDASPTAAQRTLANDFCQACAGVLTILDNGLWCMGHALLPGSTGPMLSTTILGLSDAYAAKVYAAGCIQQAVAAYPTDYLNCDNTFENCVAAQYPADPAACSADP
jgi:hypothetical protein